MSETTRLIGSAWVAIALCWIDTSLAAESPSCPKSLQVAEKPATIPEAFKAYINGNPPTEVAAAPLSVELEQISFSDGPPPEIGWLAPDHDERTYQIYGVNGVTDKPTWLTCSYSNTSIIISRPLPAGIKSCKVTHDPSIQGYPATGMTCR